VVKDRNRLTGGGVTAGIDFGLTLLAELRGDNVAKLTQLMMEYDPQPPFDARPSARGRPDTHPGGARQHGRGSLQAGPGDRRAARSANRCGVRVPQCNTPILRNAGARGHSPPFLFNYLMRTFAFGRAAGALQQAAAAS
jgi:hypothetical protein